MGLRFDCLRTQLNGRKTDLNRLNIRSSATSESGTHRNARGDVCRQYSDGPYIAGML